MSKDIIGKEVCRSDGSVNERCFVGPSDGSCHCGYTIFATNGPVDYLTSKQAQSILDENSSVWELA